TRESEDEPNHFELLSAQRIYEDGVLADPEQPWLGLKHRMAYFSNAASEYIMNNAEEVDAVMYNDWHAAYAATLIKERYFTKWSQGKTPASVFIIHNNNYGCQGVFEGKDATLLPLFGDQRLGMNSMLDGIENSDEIVTVSKTFAEEMQKPYLGFGIDPWMRQTAHKGRLSGIVNGSNPDLWDPSKNSTLKNWVDPETNQRLDLTFSAQDADILEKKQQIKQQLQKALLKYYPAEVEEFRLDLANNDFILYVGRYDSTQKGTEKFKIFLEKASALDLGFVTMGVGEDEEATEHLDELEDLAKVHKNAWITRGDKSEFSITMQRGNAAKGIPGLGPLLRAAAFMTIAPSKFEPCGLVQLESWLFGTPIIACATGGLADTVISDTISDEFNGFTFARLEEWDSEAQNSLISATIDQAVSFWAQVPSERKTQLMQNMMKSAQLSSWTSSAKGITPIQEYERVLLAAMEKRSIRGTKPVDLISVDEIPSPSRDHYFGSGLQCQLYKEFGAHIIKNEARDTGVRFKTMAPGATFVSVVIKNGIVEKTYPMQSIGDGSWQVEIPDARKGTVYMYELTDSKGNVRRKVDPFAFESHEKTDVGSVVTDIENFTWTDESWMIKRDLATERPVNIYEIHLSSFGKNTDGTFKNYREIAHDLAEWAGYLGYTHIEILGLLEHPADCSWGYQVSGYFSPTKRHGNFEDFQYFINHLHENNIGIIVDFVPYHFATDEWSLREFGGQKFFESAHPYNGESPEWGTRVFAVEREDVRNFLLSSAHFLLENHIDGLRVDAVSMLASHKLYSKRHRKSELNEQNTHENLHGETFLRSLTTMAHEKFANIITHSENSRSKPLTKVDTDPVEQGGYGFDGRWNFNFLHSSLELLGASSHARSRYYLHKIISSFGYEQDFQNILAISHDEVSCHKQSLYQKAQSDDHTIKMSKIRINKTLQMLAPGRGVLTFMGCEFGTKEKWDYRKPFSRSEISDEQHLGTLNLSRDLNAFYLSNKAFWNAGSKNSRFHLLAHHADNLIFAHRRWDEEGNRFTIIHNFSDKSYDEYYFKGSKDVLPLPISNLEIVFDSDKVTYGGSGIYQHQRNPILESPNSKGIRKFKVQLAAFTTLVLKDEYYFKGSKDVLPLPISNLEIVFDSDKVTYGGSGIYHNQRNPILESPNSN
ncbi:MAG: hypothetical protein FJZ57_01070, partial [Chlamydiae bacterium]|nr:hypothetical protein [Chlamydiota bacterium]